MGDNDDQDQRDRLTRLEVRLEGLVQTVTKIEGRMWLMIATVLVGVVTALMNLIGVGG